MKKPNCRLCDLGHPIIDGIHVPTQSHGMIPPQRCKRVAPKPINCPVCAGRLVLRYRYVVTITRYMGYVTRNRPVQACLACGVVVLLHHTPPRFLHAKRAPLKRKRPRERA